MESRRQSRITAAAIASELNAQDESKRHGATDTQALGAGFPDAVDLEILEAVEGEQDTELGRREEAVLGARAVLRPIVNREVDLRAEVRLRRVRLLLVHRAAVNEVESRTQHAPEVTANDVVTHAGGEIVGAGDAPHDAAPQDQVDAVVGMKREVGDGLLADRLSRQVLVLRQADDVGVA